MAICVLYGTNNRETFATKHRVQDEAPKLNGQALEQKMFTISQLWRSTVLFYVTVPQLDTVLIV